MRFSTAILVLGSAIFAAGAAIPQTDILGLGALGSALGNTIGSITDNLNGNSATGA